MPFSGDRTVEAPLTWAQRETWRGIRFKRLIPVRQVVPEGRTLDDVTRALSWALTTFEGLRTHHPLDREGHPRQVIERAGTLELLVAESSPDTESADIDSLMAHLTDRPYDPTAELPLRCALLTLDGAPRHLLMAASHLSLDRHGYLVVRDAIDGYLRSAFREDSVLRKEQATPRLQPADRARRERSPAGEKHSRASLAHWRRMLETCAVDESPRSRAVMRSPAVWRASAILAERYRVTTSAVLLAATAVLAGVLSSRTACVFTAPAANRIQPEDLAYAGDLVQHAIGAVDGLDGTFAEVCNNAWAAAVEAYLHSQYDPLQLDALRRELDDEYGQRVNANFSFNDMRDQRAARAPVPAGSASANDFRELRRLTSFHGRGPFYTGNSRLFSVLVSDGAGDVVPDGHHNVPEIALYVDNVCPGPVRVDELLLAVEELVVGTAVEDKVVAASPWNFLTGRLAATP
ncbi:condensation domain-containing protein [Streptomyces sp. NPDC051554]|uniref:condensation domain-containing protein n=1 Tax=Streptomyces sp. NPDC051554 TaxID=3365656 RepID=UPI00378E96F0